MKRQWLRLLWPPSWFAVFSSAKGFSSHPVLGSSTLNAWGLHAWRKSLAERLCQARRKRMRAKLPVTLTAQWDKNGYVRVDDFLDPDELAALGHELAEATFPVVEMEQPPALTRRANLDAQTCSGSYPALNRVITDSMLLGLLHYAAGYRGRPTVAVQCIHSDRDDPHGQHDPQTDWHVDTFHSTAKAWLFLHPVSADEGPLAYVTGSHKQTESRLRWEQAQSVVAASHANALHAKGSFRASDAELAAMGYADHMVAAVPANTLIVADTGGFHRRMPSPHSTVRVEIYFSLRRNPFFAGLYPSLLALPWLRNHWAGAAFVLYKWLHKRGTPLWIPSVKTGLNEVEKQTLRRSVG